MFVYDEDSRFCYFNPNTFEASDQYFLVGAVLGLAIYNSIILDVALPPFTFRKLLAAAPFQQLLQSGTLNSPNVVTGATTSTTSTIGNTHTTNTVTATTQYSSTISGINPRPFSAKLTLDDLEQYQPAVARGLRQLLDFEGDVESTFCCTFVIAQDGYGVRTERALCPGGEKRAVTNKNRREFVELYVHHLLDATVARQFEPFKRGFFSVCGGTALLLFQPVEIEQLIRGSSDAVLDVMALRAVAAYDNWTDGSGRPVPDPADSVPVVKWFWELLAEADARDQRKILGFITASDRLPALGAGSLVIKLVCMGGDSDRFPVARTCFNVLQLYRYGSRRKLVEKLWRAVVDSEGFGLR